jgi:uncharacterized membrane protein YuzA (DUF378 family)
MTFSDVRNFTAAKVVVRNSETTKPHDAVAKGWRTGMRQLDVLATALLIVGALNWGLVGIAQFDLVAAIFGMSFGETSALSSVVYVLVGLAGAYRAVAFNGVRRPVTIR